MKKILLGSALTTSVILTGCGSDSTDTTTTATTGYFIDSAVANLDYDCVTDGTSAQTDTSGAFTCQNMNQVRFRIGNLVLGEINILPQDGYVMPQDVVGVPRDDVTNPQVTAMAQLLQSLDTDADPLNGITIADETKGTLPAETLTPESVDIYLNAAYVSPAQIRTQTQAQEHLRATTQSMNATTATTTTESTQQTSAISTTTSTLSQEVKDTIAYMGNEERLAYDIYMNLYNYHMAQGTTITQLQNIAQNAEVTHIDLVQSLVRKYDLGAEDLTNVTNPVADSSITQDQMPSGQYGIPAIQSLYDTLYAKGINSAQDALEVGCMVEVTDINDLNEDIAIAQASNAQDVVDTFLILRDGSYNHYWAFDNSLKNMGVSDGCCSLGTSYCHPEYPQNNNSGGQGGGNGQGHGRR